MLFDKIDETLRVKGFRPAKVEGAGGKLKCLLRREGSFIQVCFVVDNTEGNLVPPSVLVNLQKNMDNGFVLNGLTDVEMFTLIISDDPARDAEAGYGDLGLKFWIVDVFTNRLLIFENQPAEFCNMSYEIENMLANNTPMSRAKEQFGKINPRKLPFVTIALVVINVIVFIICEMLGDTMDGDFMSRCGAGVADYIVNGGEYYRLFTMMFLHFGLEHLLSNMFMLGILGSQIENKTGHLRFALIYIVSGLAASTASILHIIDLGLGKVSVSAGASGAIYGILGVFIVWILFDKKNGILRMNRHNRNVAYRRLLIVILLVLSQGYFNPEVDVTAHTAGMLVGALLGLISMMTQGKETNLR